MVLAFFDLANHLSRRGEDLARRAGLTTQQWLMLLHIAGDPGFGTGGRSREEGMLASAIAEARGVSRANVSALLAALLRRRANRALLAGLSPRARKQLLGHLRSCLRALGTGPPGAARQPREAYREASP